jgi:methylglutaconyl-CoA hydratase
VSDPSIVTNIATDGRATVTLNRPDVHNAFDDELIARLAGDLEKLDQDSGVGVVILAAGVRLKTSVASKIGVDISP